MDTKTLQLISRFSLPPNSLGYCGRDSAPEKFKSCVIDNDCSSVAEEVKNFIVLYPYLKTISQLINKPLFSYEVSEAYWLGNAFLEEVDNSDYTILLEKFKEQGVPPWLIEELREDIPNRFIPTHLFQVLHVGVGRASGSVPYNIETINNCMIRWGRISGVTQNQIIVRLNSLEELNANKYQLVIKEEVVDSMPGFVKDLNVDSIVAIHWGQIVKSLSEKEVKDLSFWTSEVLDSL